MLGDSSFLLFDDDDDDELEVVVVVEVSSLMELPLAILSASR